MTLQVGAALGINVVNPGDVLTISAVIGNASGATTPGITKSGSGLLVLSANDTYTGTTTISSGTLQLGDGVANNGSVGAIADNAVLTFANPNAQTYSGAISGSGLSTIAGPGALTLSGTISGSGALSKTGTGLLTLSGNNTFSGATTLSAGTLDLASQNAVKNSTVAMSGGGTLVFDSSAGGAFTLGGLSAPSAGPGYDIALQDNAGSPNPVAVTVGGNNASTTYAGDLSGSGSLTKSGTGMLTLSGTNSYSGGTTVSAGTLQMGAALALSGNLAVGSGGLLDLNGNSPTVAGLSGAGTVGNNAASSSSTFTVGASNATSTFSGVIQNGSGQVGLTKTGTGNLTLNGANTFSYSYGGPTTVLAGTLTSSQDFTGTSYLAVASGATVVANTSNLTYNNAGPAAFAPWYVNGVVYSSSGVVQTTGNVTLGGGTLTGAAPGGGSYGNYTVNGASYMLTSSGNSLINAPAGFSLQGSNALSINVVNPTDVLTMSSGGFFNAPGAGQTAGITKTGSGLLVLAVNSTYSGTTTISGGTLQLGDGVANNGSVASNIADNAVLTFANPNAQTYTGAIGGNGALIKTGTGALTLKTATNTYSGATTVSTGTLIAYQAIPNTSYLAVASGALFDAEVNTVTYNGVNVLAPWYVNGTVYSGSGVYQSLGNLTLGSGTLNGAATGYSSYGNYSDYGALFSITSSGNSLINAPAGMSLQGSKALGINVVNPGDVLTISAGIINAPAATNPGITLSGSGTLLLTGNNTYTGSTAISGGTLQILGSGDLGGGNYAGNISIAGSAALIVNTSSNQTFGGTISGAGGLTQAGPGTLTLNGAPNYSGPTTVSGGTLTASMPLPNTSCVAVANGATLDAETNNVTYPKLRSSVRFGGGFLEESNVSPIISGCRRRKVVVVEIPSRASLSNVGWKTIL